jgi:glycerophosphoryl diester phosphodiesterase
LQLVKFCHVLLKYQLRKEFTLPDQVFPLMVHHKAAVDHIDYPPNSLEAIRASLEAGARFIEVDIVALASDDFILLHDATFDAETNSTGIVNQCPPSEARALLIKDKDQITPYHPPFLSDVVTLFLEFGGECRLQLDYKDVYPRESDEQIQRLIRLIEPLGSRVLVSSGADWHLRRMHQMAGWLDLGFDIGYYLDYRPRGSEPETPPYRLGAYGYHDDHPLATRAIVSKALYLKQRCESMIASTPFASIWYVNHHLIADALKYDFNMADLLHEHGIKLDAWTLDYSNPAARENAPHLLRAGVDQFTSNEPLALASYLKG